MAPPRGPCAVVWGRGGGQGHDSRPADADPGAGPGGAGHGHSADFDRAPWPDFAELLDLRRSFQTLASLRSLSATPERQQAPHPGNFCNSPELPPHEDSNTCILLVRQGCSFGFARLFTRPHRDPRRRPRRQTSNGKLSVLATWRKPDEASAHAFAGATPPSCPSCDAAGEAARDNGEGSGEERGRGRRRAQPLRQTALV